jgi:hypothetical protein
MINDFIGQSSQWFWVMLQSLVVGLTLIYLAKQLRMQSKTNLVLAKQFRLQTQSHLVNAFAVMHDRWQSPILLVARTRFCGDWKHSTERISPAIAQVAMFFEEMETYCKIGILDPDVAWEIYSFEIEHYWVMAENAITSFRSSKNDSTFYKNFEMLYKLMLDLSQKKGAPSSKRTAAELTDFIQLETEMVQLISGIANKSSGGSATS